MQRVAFLPSTNTHQTSQNIQQVAFGVCCFEKSCSRLRDRYGILHSLLTEQPQSPAIPGGRDEMKIEDLNSIGIAIEASRFGIDEVILLADNSKQGDARVTVYRVGDVRVADTNGDPVWEESDPSAFKDILDAEGFSL
jgi:hypothetical protein